MKQSEGQIKLESKVGIMLYDFIKNHEINDVLEIGTWNGRGSTKVLYESLKENKDVFTLTSIETDKIAYKSAKKYNQAIKYYTIIINSLDDDLIKVDQKKINKKIDKQEGLRIESQSNKNIEILKNNKPKSNFI